MTTAIDAVRFEKANAEEILIVALQEFGPRFGIATSFQSEGQVLAHMATRIDPKARIFTLDTGRLPAETLDPYLRQVTENFIAAHGSALTGPLSRRVTFSCPMANE